MPEAAEALEARAAEVLELTKLIEELTGGTPEWYAGMGVEVAEALRQARVLERTLGPLEESTNVSGGISAPGRCSTLREACEHALWMRGGSPGPSAASVVRGRSPARRCFSLLRRVRLLRARYSSPKAVLWHSRSVFVRRRGASSCA